MNKVIATHLLLLAATVSSGCYATKIRNTAPPPVAAQAAQPLAEELLLDVGVGIFDPGVSLEDQDETKRNARVSPELRKAEARYMPQTLATTLQNTGNWGVVRVIPERQSEMDVWVDGTIMESDGERLKVRIAVQDASGKSWFTRVYQEENGKYDYDKDFVRQNEPFQGLYNRIANDMLAHRKTLDAQEVKKLRTIAELKFAQRFSPEAFSEYLDVSKNGRSEIKRLPAQGDPLLERVRRIRERDNLFVDTLQDYYSSFAKHMREPYTRWRADTYNEVRQVRQIESSRNKRIAGGILAGVVGVGAAVLSSGSGAMASTAGMMAGAVGLGAGGMLIKSGLDKRTEAKVHYEALKEMSASLDAAIKPHTVSLEDRTVTLTGTVQEQYAQWREILKNIYQTETGVAAGPGEAH